VSRRQYLAGVAAVGGGFAVAGLPSLDGGLPSETTFTVRTENVSNETDTTLDPTPAER
jgi:hypothetical protein